MNDRTIASTWSEAPADGWKPALTADGELGGRDLAVDELHHAALEVKQLAPKLGADDDLLRENAVLALAASASSPGDADLLRHRLHDACATVAAAGPEAASTFLLAPALVLSIGWAIWDAAGRPELGEWMPEGHTPRGLLALFDAGQGLSEHVRDPHEPRNPADAPMADDQIRATRAARRHVRAALHGAGSRGGLP